MQSFFSARLPLAASLSVAFLAACGVSQAQNTSPATTNSLRGEADFRSSYYLYDLNVIAHADRFYNAGYTGSRAVATVVDAGHIWNQHDTLKQVTTFLDASQLPGDTSKNNSINGLGAYDNHATSVGFTLAGRDNTPGASYLNDSTGAQYGIAYGATLWSGATSTKWINSGSFDVSYTSFLNPYYRALITGVNGRTTDVVNSSIGFPSYDATGTSFLTGAMDGLALQSRRTLVQSAGNDRVGANHIGAVASGFNTLSVGSVGSYDSAPAYSYVSYFSSGGPQDYQDPNRSAVPTPDNQPDPPVTSTVISGVRARVDILAAGQNLFLAEYGGATGGNAGGQNNLSTSLYDGNANGTSFSAPTVAGGVALLADAAYDRYTGTTLANALDGEVMKAVLLNSSDKLAGWNNGQATINGVTQTTQALDFVQGAGRMNLDRAFDQYLSGTQDVIGLGGGAVATRGWDYGQVGQSLFNDYVIGQPLLAGSQFTATLNWFVNVRYTGTETVLDDTTVYWDNFADLYLEMYRTGAGGDTLIARSDARYLNTEHFFVTLDQTGLYKLRVGYRNDVYDYTTSTANPNGITTQNYGLAWFGTAAPSAAAPEPGTLALWFATGAPLAVVAVRRKRRQK